MLKAHIFDAYHMYQNAQKCLHTDKLTYFSLNIY